MNDSRVVSRFLAASMLAGVLAAQPGSAAQGDCAQPLSTGGAPVATDCLFILSASVGNEVCAMPCVCDPGGDGNITATDALQCLFVAVGNPGILLNCPCSSATTTTTTSTTSTTMMQGCGGLSHSNACWYLAEPMTSCDTACDGLGLSCDETATRDIAGSGGTLAACGEIVDLLSPASAPHPRSELDSASCGADLAVGCERFPDRFGTLGALRRTAPVTTCAADGESDSCFSTGSRVCACVAK